MPGLSRQTSKARSEGLLGFGMGEIQPAAARHEEFATKRRHALENADATSALTEILGREKPGRASSDNGDVRAR